MFMNSMIITVLLVLLISEFEFATPLKEFRYLQALPCVGKYSPGGLHSEYIRTLRSRKTVEIEKGFVKADRDQLSAFYLGPSKLVVEECNIGDERCIVRGTIPVPIRSVFSDDIESSLLAAMRPDRDVMFDNWNAAVITDRDKGLFDNLSVVFKKWRLVDAKRKIFESLKIRKDQKAPSPYHALRDALQTHAGLKITGLLLEVADTIDEVSLSLGAAILVARSDLASDWRLTVSNYRELTRAERTSDDAMIVDCTLDELLGMHLATTIPIVISKSLFDRVCIDGLLERTGTQASDTRLLTPYFDTEREQLSWTRQLEAARAKPPKPVPKVLEIRDASTFLRMRLSEKRACLRASGILKLPRPREGPRSVDAVIIPLLDEEVAYEVLRRLGETRGDFKEASKMEDYQSRRPSIARAYAAAVREGDKQLAQQMIDELNALATLSFDPSNPEAETPKGGFDIEEWYWEQRKRVYGIIAA